MPTTTPTPQPPPVDKPPPTSVPVPIPIPTVSADIHTVLAEIIAKLNDLETRVTTLED